MQTLFSQFTSLQMLESRFAAKRFEAKRFESEAIRSEATGAKRGPEFSQRSTGLQRNDDFRSAFQIIEFDGLPSKSWNSSVGTPNQQLQQQHHYQQHQHQCQKQTHEQEQHLHFLTAAQKRDFP